MPDSSARTKRRLWITLIVVTIGLAAIIASIIALRANDVALETPSYRLVDTIGPVEIREYPPQIVAETVVDGDRQSVGSEAFEILAAYIFGANRPRAEIAMTAPVTQERRKIAMTAPVTQLARDGRFAIQFIMPSEYELDELPLPEDERVEIREVPARRLAAIRYSGSWSTKNYETHLARLQQVLKEHGYQPEGEPIWARYNPPFTPWFMRRNEILTEIRRVRTPVRTSD